MRASVLLLSGLGLAVLGATTAPAQAQMVTVSRQACDAITVHTPAPDVAYKAGEDVYGRKVASADVGGGSPVILPDEVQVNVGVDLDEKYGLGAGGIFESHAVLGKVTVKDGALYWNDKRIDSAEEHAILEACKKLAAGQPARP
jgi:hypothetical protein